MAAIATLEPVLLWKPNPGPQEALVNCPIEEVFFGGARGGGKTEGSLGDWLLHAYRYGEHAHGVFFRKTLTQLDQVIERTQKLFNPLGAKYKDQKKKWIFPNGATLKFRYLEKKKDAENYQGHEYTRLYFEEAPNWGSPELINMLRGTLRSRANVPCRIRLTGNPGGPGHQWVRARYIDAAPPMTPIYDDETESYRVFIPSRIDDNPFISRRSYESQLQQVGTPELVKAWLEGDWNIIAGAFLGSVWNSAVHVVEPFTIPAHWLRWRSMDWGFAKPFCVLWFAQDEQGNVFVYRELYGIEKEANGMIKPNVGSRQTAEEVAGLIRKAEEPETKAGIEIRGNPADPAIWSNTGTELSIEEHFRRGGVSWWKADNAAGSRKQGAQEVVRRLKAGNLKFFSNCIHTIRTVSAIPTSERDPEDVDTQAEDHAWDTLRYGLRRRKPKSNKPEVQETDPMAWMRSFG